MDPRKSADMANVICMEPDQDRLHAWPGHRRAWGAIRDDGVDFDVSRISAPLSEPRRAIGEGAAP